MHLKIFKLKLVREFLLGTREFLLETREFLLETRGSNKFEKCKK